MRLRVALPLATALLLGAFRSPAIGTRSHAEVGRMCVEDYLENADPMLPGLGSMFKDVEIRRILYGGCAFSDWGFGGVNPEAGEASHWRPFENAWAGVLKERHYAMPPSQAAQKELAFFMGAVCHNIADLPWHFSHGKDLSFVHKAGKMDHATHLDVDSGLDLVRYAGKAQASTQTPSDWVPYETIMAALRSAKVNATEQQVRSGVKRERLILQSSFYAGALLADKFRPGLKWSLAHVMDYYYGGLEHGAASAAMWCRYWYADILGGYCLQQMPLYFDNGGRSSQYVPYLGASDTTLLERLPANNAGQEPILEAGGPAGNRRAVLLRFDLTDVPKEARVGKAVLWLADAGPVKGVSGPVPLEVYAVPAAWEEGAGVSDPFNGVEGRAASAEEVTWSRFPAECGRPIAHATLQKTEEHHWVSLDVTALVAAWVKEPANNHGFMIRGTTDAVVRFYSSQAFRASPDGYCGGTRIAYRPMLIILP
jgi:hypothetical protein